MCEIKDKSIQQFLDELASKSATPGGGSAAALMGAQSAALTSMVCNLTIGKPRFAEVEEEMKALLLESENLREKMCGLIKADIDVFNRVMAQYALPKQTDAEKAARSAAIQAVLKEATDVPLECARACYQAIELSIIAADKGNSNVITDAGAALMAAYGGLKTAALNVYINATTLQDREFAEARLGDLEQIVKSADSIVENSYQVIRLNICNPITMTNNWIKLGPLSEKETDFSSYKYDIGVYKGTLNGEVVYIGKATELYNGGFRKRLRDYTRESDSGRNYPSGKLMHEHQNEVQIEILIFERNVANIKLVEQKESDLIKELQPKWNPLDS